MPTWYTTKHALTAGIKEIEEDGVKWRLWDDGRYLAKQTGPGYKIGCDAFSSKEEAVAHAEIMRDAKIMSLERQIKRLLKLEFGK